MYLPLNKHIRQTPDTTRVTRHSKQAEKLALKKIIFEFAIIRIVLFLQIEKIVS